MRTNPKSLLENTSSQIFNTASLASIDESCVVNLVSSITLTIFLKKLMGVEEEYENIEQVREQLEKVKKQMKIKRG